MNTTMKLLQKNITSTVWRYYAFQFLMDLTFFSGVLVPFFTDWGHISQFHALLLQSWFMMWFFLLEVPTGAIADFFGRKYSLALGAFIVSFGALLYGSIPRFEVFLISEFLFALAMSLISGADQAFLYDALKDAGKERDAKKILMRAHALNLVAIMTAAPLGSIFASRFGLNTPMMFSSIPYFLAFLVALTFKESRVYEKVSESRRYVDVLVKGFIYFYQHPKLRLLAFDAVIVNAAGYFVIWLYQPLLKGVGVPLVYFGFGTMLLTGAEILLVTNFSRLEILFGGPAKFFRFTTLLIVVGYLLVLFLPTIYTVAAFIVLAGGLGMTRIELLSTYMQPMIPSRERATILSSISMFRRFVLMALNPLVGFVANISLPWALGMLTLLPLSMFFFSPINEKTLKS